MPGLTVHHMDHDGGGVTTGGGAGVVTTVRVCGLGDYEGAPCALERILLYHHR